MKLAELFDTSYGSKLDFNKMTPVMNSTDDGINFVSRSSQNLGITARVKKIPHIEPYPAGAITVTLGGTYLLSSFVQPEPFYTAQNIMVLTPKTEMTLAEKIYYCLCISRNRFKYSAFGREANRTLRNIELPSSVPEWINTIPTDDKLNPEKSIIKNTINFSTKRWRSFTYEELFTIKKGKRLTNVQMKKGSVPCIRPIDSNNGVDRYVDVQPNHPGNTITVNYDGSVGMAFYQAQPYFAIDSINVLYPKFDLNEYIAIFLVALMRLERQRYHYGYKWNSERMSKSLIKLPVDDSGKPDWKFMEHFIKSLPFSSSLGSIN